MTDLSKFANSPLPTGAQLADLNAFQLIADYKLPDDVRQFYAKHNGMDVHNLHIMNLSEAEEYLSNLPVYFGYFAFGDWNDSNPYCVCCKGPLRGYVVHIFHDGTNEVAFRSFSRFIEAVYSALAENDSDDYLEIEDDFSRNTYQRGEGDIAVANQLLQDAQSLDEEDGRADAIRFALTLLPNEMVDRCAPYLRDKDQYVREAATERLKLAQTDVADRLLREAQVEMDRLRQRCILELKKHGIDCAADIKHPTVISIPDRKTIHMDVGLMYSELTAPDGMAFLLKRVRTWLQLKR